MSAPQEGFIPRPTKEPSLSGERFRVTYRITGTSHVELERRARDLCLEQTVELPEDRVPPGGIRDSIVGRLESFEVGDTSGEITVSYAIETAGSELTQLLNVFFGNTSIKPGIRIQGVDLPQALLQHFRGPRFGEGGLFGNGGERPLLCSALKPMGLSAEDLGELCYRFALGGIDLIKDDHGLADQPFAPFEERLARCTAAVDRAYRETGHRARYFPNVTSAPAVMEIRAQRARDCGAGGLLVSPALTGVDAMRALADDAGLGLPIMAHPAFGGAWTVSPESGMAHGVYYGALMRLAGADATVFPSFGGRFAFSREECAEIASACRAPMGNLASILPAPGGGLTAETLPHALEVYGRRVIFLVGGGLLRLDADLPAACRKLRAIVEEGLSRLG